MENTNSSGTCKKVDILFDFCVSCGMDYMIFPTRTCFQFLIDAGCTDCGCKEYISMTATDGIKWRNKKFSSF